MFIQGQTLATALSALAFLSHAVPSTATGFGRPVHGVQHARSLRPANNARMFEKRDVAAVEQLQTEYNAFHSWVNNWLQTAPQGDTATAVAQLKQEFSAYDSYMSTWLASALNTAGGASASGTAPGSAPGPASSFLSVAPYPTASVSQGIGGSAGLSGTGSPSSGFASPTGTAPIGTAPIGTASSSTAVSSAASSSPAGSGSFNAKAKDNVVVYYGQSAATSNVKMTDLCSDKDTDIVILSFLTDFAGPGGYPTVNFGAACGGSPSSAAAAKGATGLISCPDLGKDIKTCQAAGKKVMLSLGGATGQSAFTSDDQATKFATQLWNLFGAGTGEDAGLRPFGAGVTVDGFDIGKSSFVVAPPRDHFPSFPARSQCLPVYPKHRKNPKLTLIFLIRQREQGACSLRHLRHRPPQHF